MIQWKMILRTKSTGLNESPVDRNRSKVDPSASSVRSALQSRSRRLVVGASSGLNERASVLFRTSGERRSTPELKRAREPKSRGAARRGPAWRRPVNPRRNRAQAATRLAATAAPPRLGRVATLVSRARSTVGCVSGACWFAFTYASVRVCH